MANALTAACTRSSGSSRVVEIQQPHPRQPLFAAVCGDGQHLFVYYGDKFVQCLDIESGIVKGERRMPKRPTVLVPYTFAGGKHMCLVADKFGNVHALPAPTMNQAVYLLGHTASMIADMIVTPDSKYLITCDRDEKIRVSCLPHTEKIESFCLGHTSFLCSADIVDERRLVSVAADKQLCVWDFQEGKLLGKWALQPETGEQAMNFESSQPEESESKDHSEEKEEKVLENVNEPPQDDEDDEDANADMDQAELAHVDTRGPIPLRVRACPALSLVAVATKGESNVELFRLTPAGEFDMHTSIELPEPAVEIFFLDSAAGTQLFVLLPAPHYLRVYDIALSAAAERVQVTEANHPVVGSFNELAEHYQLDAKQWLPFAELDAPEQGLVKRALDIKFAGVVEGKRKRGKKRRTA